MQKNMYLLEFLAKVESHRMIMSVKADKSITDSQGLFSSNIYT